MIHSASCRTGADAINAITITDEVDPALARPIAVTAMKRE
jgi:hypothetical protein